MEHLHKRKQTIKLDMYTRLQYILGKVSVIILNQGISFILLVLVLLGNAINASHRDENYWNDQQWVIETLKRLEMYNFDLIIQGDGLS